MSAKGTVAWSENGDGERKVDERVGRTRYDQIMHGTSHPSTSCCMGDTAKQARRMKRWRGRTGETSVTCLEDGGRNKR